MFLAGHIVAMVTYCVTKILPTCLPMSGQFFDTMIVASIDKKSGNYDPSKSTSWKVLETVMSHLKLQLRNHTSRPAAIFSAICRRDIAGASNIFER